MEKYLNKLINEGFDSTFDRELTFNDTHEIILSTSLDQPVKVDSIFSNDLKTYIKTYSIFTRAEQQDIRSDSNPVLYALKGERRWRFRTSYTKRVFWDRFVILLRKFLLDHKNEFDTKMC